MLIVGKLKLRLDEIRVRSKFPELVGGFVWVWCDYPCVFFDSLTCVLCLFHANGVSQFAEIKFRDMTR